MAWFIVISGPNGAGKTTLVSDPHFQGALQLFPGGTVRVFNPDDAVKVYYASHPGTTADAANYWAANAVPAQVIECIEGGENILTETVLSTEKYGPHIEHASHRGRYQVGLIYLALASAAVSMARVAKRAAASGIRFPRDACAGVGDDHLTI